MVSKKLSKGFYLGTFWGGLVLTFLSSYVANVLAIVGAGVFAEAFFSALSLTSLGYVVVVHCRLYYKMWMAIQDNHISTSPGKAVGFLFIPLYNIYWAFYMFVGFAEDYNAFIERHSIETKKLSRVLFFVFVFLLLFPLMPISGMILSSLNPEADTAYMLFAGIGLLLSFASLLVSSIIYTILVIKICNAINAL